VLYALAPGNRQRSGLYVASSPGGGAVWVDFTLAQGSPGALPLELNGMLMPVTVVGPSGHVDTTAEIDTGSTITGADVSLLQQVGAQPISSIPVETPIGDGNIQLYSAQIWSGNDMLTAGLPGVLGEQLSPPAQVLIGRDVLASMRLVYQGPTGQWSLQTATAVPRPSTALIVGVGAVLVAAGVGLAIYGERLEYRLHASHARRAAAPRDAVQRLLRDAAPGGTVRGMQVQMVTAISRAHGPERRALLEAASEVAAGRGPMAEAARGALQAFSAA
jgi:hypothetical protein